MWIQPRPSCCSQTCVGGLSGISITGEGQGTGSGGSLLRPGGEAGLQVSSC